MTTSKIKMEADIIICVCAHLYPPSPHTHTCIHEHTHNHTSRSDKASNGHWVASLYLHFLDTFNIIASFHDFDWFLQVFTQISYKY